MASGNQTTLGDVQDETREIFRMYTNLTSILLEFGYEYIQEHMEKGEEVACIAETLNFLELFDSMMGGEESMMRDEEPSVRPDNDYLLRIASARKRIMNDKNPVERKKKIEIETLRDEYLNLAAKLNERLSKSNLQPSGPEEFFNKEFERSAHVKSTRKPPQLPKLFKVSPDTSTSFNSSQHINQLQLKTLIKERVHEKLKQSIPGTKIQGNNQTQSINVESFDLKI